MLADDAEAEPVEAAGAGSGHQQAAIGEILHDPRDAGGDQTAGDALAAHVFGDRRHVKDVGVDGPVGGLDAACADDGVTAPGYKEVAVEGGFGRDQLGCDAGLVVALRVVEGRQQYCGGGFAAGVVVGLQQIDGDRFRGASSRKAAPEVP